MIAAPPVLLPAVIRVFTDPNTACIIGQCTEYALSCIADV